MSNIPPNIKNVDLYTAFLNFLKRVINDNQQLLNDICQLKESRKLLTYYPNLKSYLTPLIPSSSFQDVYLTEHRIKEDISLHRIVDFVIDGIYEEVKDLKEYKDCVIIMDSDDTIKNQVGNSLSFFGSLQRMHHWTYLSHFLKSMLFDYFEECKLNPDRLSEYMGNLESFFYQNELEVIDISPLHHFQ